MGKRERQEQEQFLIPTAQLPTTAAHLSTSRSTAFWTSGVLMLKLLGVGTARGP